MAVSRVIPTVLLLLGVVFLQACNKTLVVENVNYAQQIESVLTPDSKGMVTDVRHAISYSIMPLQFLEFKDTTSVKINEVRMIRNQHGFYFITADQFKHVYVMTPEKGALKLKKKILVNEEGIISPAFNWRAPDVQLISLYDSEIYLLNENGIKKSEESQS